MNGYITGAAVVMAVIVSLIPSPGLAKQPEAGTNPEQAGQGVIKVFILAGQSNMAGQGVVSRNYNDGKGNLVWSMQNSQSAGKMKHLKNANGEWVVRDDVQISFKTGDKVRKGGLTVGYTGYGGSSHIGPELQFGHVMGDYFDEPVLLIKTAWGGKSLYVDFRPPSSGGRVGPFYTKMIEEVRAALAELNGREYELAGFVWMQGWNDMCTKAAIPEYAQNLVNLIKDIRKEFNAPNMPVVIGELGNGGPIKGPGAMADFRKAQEEGTKRINNAVFVKTADFARPKELSPNVKHVHHWYGNAESYFLIGNALAEGLIGATNQIQKGEMAGYLLVANERVQETYNAGFSMYVAAWPLLEEYPGRRFQTGLFGTWMHAQYDGPKPAGKLYSDIEGGLGWWRDTRFATETPKFIMGGVALNFCAWANGPGAGKGRDWDEPKGKYGVAQLSPWLLWPPDGLNLKQGTCGELFGYGYLPLPLTEVKSTTAGKNVPTGNNCWTLFLNTGNFKGPVAFFTPYFWSRPSVDVPHLGGMFLDSRPSGPNRALQMETQYIPSVQAIDKNGETYARIAPTRFPRGAEGDSVVVHRVTSYSKKALWDAVKTWFEGGPPAGGKIDPAGASVHGFPGRGGATWKIYVPPVPREQRMPIAWTSFASPMAFDSSTFGYRWNNQLVTKTDTRDGPLVTLPEYFRLVKGDKKDQWVVVRPEDVPVETGLANVSFSGPLDDPPEPYVTPDDAGSCWKKPGPVAGPFDAHPGDGSVVTYYWYRFADQPALLNADLTDEERENLQKRVERIHRNWKKDRNYLTPPTIGKLADIDPALIVTPPLGLEVGYVPIATRQAAEER